MATFLEGSKNNQIFIDSRSSTNPTLVKIGPADVEIIGLREIVKTRRKKYETKAEHEFAFGCALCSPDELVN